MKFSVSFSDIPIANNAENTNGQGVPRVVPLQLPPTPPFIEQEARPAPAVVLKITELIRDPPRLRLQVMNSIFWTKPGSHETEFPTTIELGFTLRIREEPTFTTDDKNNKFILTLNYRASENPNAITYFTFTCPFSHADLQNRLKKMDNRILKLDKKVHLAYDIYYHRKCY
ncbi:hypothetical protein QAD02_010552 [Eretmocerus hayati]|uniref:Uncharacterized protein n=1 Tax=Eretmocerus hayati TaxID=131215 RepID=A0ACC2NUD3_9HYME|nr:hypothetical protein QAD02_010552 [Eretmocerus hayati]